MKSLEHAAVPSTFAFLLNLTLAGAYGTRRGKDLDEVRARGWAPRTSSR
jgi:hypothetical protein